MNTRHWVAGILSLSACLSAMAAQDTRPDMVLILADDQGYNDLGMRGRKYLRTPNLDRLAEQSAVFERFYTNPSCTPTRAALLTGKNYLKTGVFGVGFGSTAVSLNCRLMPQYLKEKGYATAMYGKWHIGVSDHYLPHQRGFDESWSLHKNPVVFHGKHEHLDPSFLHNGRPVEQTGWSATILTDRALEFAAQKRAENQPIFLYMAYPEPHEPWQAPPEYLEKYRALGLSDAFASLNGMTEFLDHEIGRLLDGLAAQKTDRDIVVFFLGDNGATPKGRVFLPQADGRYARPGELVRLTDEEWRVRNPLALSGEKGTVREDGIRNNLFVCWPDQIKSGSRQQLAHVSDLFPTILSLAGCDEKLLPSDIDSINLSPWLFGDAEPLSRPVFVPQPHSPAEIEKDGFRYRDTGKVQNQIDCNYAWIQDGFKLLVENGRTQLFNLETDPCETTDRSAAFPERLAGMKAEAEAALADAQHHPDAYGFEPMPVGGLFASSRLESSYAFRYRGRIDFGWHGAQIRKTPARADFKFRVLEKGTYRLSAELEWVCAGARVSGGIEGRPLQGAVTGKSRRVDFGEVKLLPGDYIFVFEVEQLHQPEAVLPLLAVNVEQTGKM